MTASGAPSYEAAGVSIEAGDRAVELMRSWIDKASRPEVIGGIGGFAGLFDASALKEYDRPLLAASADGVGTKVAIAQAMDRHDTIGFDLVGMLVDDLVVVGAEPLFLTDYIACGQVDPERIAAIVSGVARACAEVGCALIGGETAEHPGLLEPAEYDLAGATTGVVEAANLLGPDRVRPGDLVVAMGSSGLHSNGYSLARHVFFDRADWRLDRHVDELGRTLGEELLEPTRLYARPCLTAARDGLVHALAHITGGGLGANLSRVVPPTVSITVDRSTWCPQPIFDVIGRLGSVARDDLERTFNMGVGMVAVTSPAAVDQVLLTLRDHEVDAWVAGEVRDNPGGSVTLSGSYA